MTEQQLAYRMLRAALHGEKPCCGTAAIDAGRWWSLFRTLQKNHVAALCYDAAAQAGVPREVLMPWLAEREKVADRHRYQLEVQRDIVQRMEAHGIETLVLKGTHVAQYYPQPELREFGDLDLYFYHRHREADTVARRELDVSISNRSHHHTKYDYRGVTVESHYDFVNTHYPPSNRRYEQRLKALAPTPTFEVLFLLRHMACHFAASRITLRDLADWVLTCGSLRQQADWAQVQQELQQSGMERFAGLLSLVAERQLGLALPLPAVTGSDAADDVLRVEHDIVYGCAEADDREADGLARLGWKLRRWNALGWKRRMVFADSAPSLLLSSLTSHAEKPDSILHKM